MRPLGRLAVVPWASAKHCGMTPFRIPRSRAHHVHRQLRDDILRALEPMLFESAELEPAAERNLQSQFAALLHRRHAVACNSATSGLFLALLACGVKPGDEVVTVGNSDISTSSAISHCGGRPVFCDIQPDDFTIDPALVEACLTSRTRALLPVDLYGHPADVRALRHLAEAHDLKIVEDAALALGACDYEQPVGAFADATVFSFGANKPLGSAGNGGMVVTDDDQIAEMLQLYRGYGRSPREAYVAGQPLHHAGEGYNLPIDPLQAAIIGVKLPFLARWTERRREIAQIYSAGLAEIPVRLPTFRPESDPMFHSYVIRVPNRDALHTNLRRNGIESVMHYAPPVLHQAVYQSTLGATVTLPVTDQAAAELLCLPVTPELLDEEVHFVIDTLRDWFVGGPVQVPVAREPIAGYPKEF